MYRLVWRDDLLTVLVVLMMTLSSFLLMFLRVNSLATEHADRRERKAKPRCPSQERSPIARRSSQVSLIEPDHPCTS
jgi:hypothetical protein